MSFVIVLIASFVAILMLLVDNEPVKPHEPMPFASVLVLVLGELVAIVGGAIAVLLDYAKVFDRLGAAFPSECWPELVAYGYPATDRFSIEEQERRRLTRRLRR